MSQPSQRAKFVPLVPAIALPLSVAACSTTDNASPGAKTSTSAAVPSLAAHPPAWPHTSTSESPTVSQAPSTAAPSDSTSAPFGPSCAAVPTSGKGSFDGMSADRVATAASNNPLLSTLVTAVKAAGLVDTLNNAEDITVFAPSNDAFKSINQTTLRKALANPSMLSGVLTGHVVAGRLAPADLSGEHQTLNKDAKITVTGSGEEFKVNGTASVICGNVQTANATVYIIDEVLMPAS
jgi:uncharacterized surface protein with fasciclin (FAS1) repeats